MRVREEECRPVEIRLSLLQAAERCGEKILPLIMSLLGLVLGFRCLIMSLDYLVSLNHRGWTVRDVV
jgi:hypothetical protein